MNPESELTKALNQLNANLQRLQTTLNEVRAAYNIPKEQYNDTIIHVSDDVFVDIVGEQHRKEINERLANRILAQNGYLDECIQKLTQWGVMECKTDNEVAKIIYEVIDYRRDSSLHSTGVSNL